MLYLNNYRVSLCYLMLFLPTLKSALRAINVVLPINRQGSHEDHCPRDIKMEKSERSSKSSGQYGFVSVRGRVRKLKPRVPYTQKKGGEEKEEEEEEEEAHRWWRRGGGRRERGRNKMVKKSVARDVRGGRGLEEGLIHIAIGSWNRPRQESPCGILPLLLPAALLLPLLRLLRRGDGRRCWPSLAAARRIPVFAFVLAKKRPSLLARGCEKLFLASPSHGADQAKERKKKTKKKKTKTAKKTRRERERR